jgi:hypothetical protein
MNQMRRADSGRIAVPDDDQEFLVRLGYFQSRGNRQRPAMGGAEVVASPSGESLAPDASDTRAEDHVVFVEIHFIQRLQQPVFDHPDTAAMASFGWDLAGAQIFLDKIVHYLTSVQIYGISGIRRLLDTPSKAAQTSATVWSSALFPMK